MKLSYTKPDGKRSSITLSDKLLDVWSLTLMDGHTVEEELVDRILPEAMKGKRSPNVTLVSLVEFMILQDIEEVIKYDYQRRGECK